MPATDAFLATFARLHAVLARFTPSLLVTTDGPDRFSLDAPSSSLYPDGLFCGEARVGKRYVSYHLMPVYVFPDLLDAMSPALARRMQGKSCFNFLGIDDSAVAELEALTAAGLARYRAEGLVG
ncbi:MAG: hypothetical protein M3P94_02145 [Chloroflexota bacterium]|nr:hypothetical protein [Chloroflexota bacterium]